jgi:hypothetical protein
MTFDVGATNNTSSGTKTPDELLLSGPLVTIRTATRTPKATASAQGELSRDAAWRHTRVSTAAYYISQQRGFESGSEARDWKLAELQIDALDEAQAG